MSHNEDEEEYDDEGDEDDEENDDADDDDDEEDYVPPVDTKAYIDGASVTLFVATEDQIESFYTEFSGLSKKKPDSPINEFKVGLLNHTLENANSLLPGEYRPFPTFTVFDKDSLPTTSDVVVVLAQYARSMDRFRVHYSHKTTYGDRIWNVRGSQQSYPAKRGKDFDD